MERNTVCTIGDVIRARRDLWMEGGSDALARDLEWYIYTEGTEEEYGMDTPCIIADPPGYDEEREMELFPDLCDVHRMYGELMPEMLDDVLISALEQKRDASEAELLRALNYYEEMDAFLQF
ncbi:hypothetical protein AALC17_07975 [Oscillospiraceae bacterium 38-13]